MKSLIKNYINLLTIEKIKNFAIKNNINLTNQEAEYFLELLKNDFENIISNEKKYFKEIKENISNSEYNKIINLYIFYKEKYKKYLF